jgi:hypothetical protein
VAAGNEPGLLAQVKLDITYKLVRDLFECLGKVQVISKLRKRVILFELCKLLLDSVSPTILPSVVVYPVQIQRVGDVGRDFETDLELPWWFPRRSLESNDKRVLGYGRFEDGTDNISVTQVLGKRILSD